MSVEDKATQTRLETLADEGHEQQVLYGEAEQDAGLSGVYLRATWDCDLIESSPMGRSHFQGIRDVFEAIDDVWTSWMRDIRLARARLIAPDGYLRGPDRAQGSTTIARSGIR
ncbi:hypothetical protein [Streptomyces sp. NPDC088360]|uniref:hypothetical protein n=1 Tax=unclassified Streptomyces TaxID=2593676 RepID=UPI0034501C5D